MVGEITGGGAHGTHPFRLNEHFSASIPFSYSVNPITKTDWEGKGVQPDVKVPKEQALLEAQIASIKMMLSDVNNKSDRTKYLNDLLTRRENELSVMQGNLKK